MTDINEIELRRLDGTLMLVFLGLMRHRRATRVAQEMGLTQPAISHALRRLRAIYDDPLFLKTGHGFEPTARARLLEPAIRGAVRALSGTIVPPGAFEPATSEAVLRIAGFDHALATVVPALIADLAATAPGIELRSAALGDAAALRAVERGEADLAIGFFETLPAREPGGPFVSDDLYVEEYVMVARARHPALTERTVASYADAPHLLVVPGDARRGAVDFALDGLGAARNVRASVPTFFSALTTLAGSDLIATLPRSVAETHGARFGLGHAPLPFPSPTFAVRAVRHRRDAEDPVRRWVLDRLRMTSISRPAPGPSSGAKGSAAMR